MDISAYDSYRYHSVNTRFGTRSYYESPLMTSVISPTLLRPRLPGRVTRQERYTRSLSNPSLPLRRELLSYKYPEKTDNEKFHSSAFTSYRTQPKEKYSSKTKDNSFYSRDLTLPRWWKKESQFCTPNQLLDIIKEPVGYYALPTDPYNEVFPGIYLSDAPTALCTALLKKLGITHVLNAAQGKERHAGQVNTWPGFYSYSGIKFLGVEAFDNIVFRLYVYFEEAAQFIDDALKSGGKVLVHCRAGISRSATLVCAFLMTKRNMSVQEAVRTVRQHRAIIPNDGFLQQLCDLNDRLLDK